MLEEIENGINPGNIQEFLDWLWQATGSAGPTEDDHTTQFMLTSHSPSVMREFADYLDHVYVMRLDRKKFSTITTNLSDALKALVGIGQVEGELIEEGESQRVRIPRHQLTELWYSGSIG